MGKFQRLTNKELWPAGSLRTERVRSDMVLQQVFLHILDEEKLPDLQEMLSLLDSLYLPMAQWIAEQHTDQPLVIGINGSQGSGKSTLCKILQRLLEVCFDKRVVSVSIDDLYLTRMQRQVLAKKVHPLLETRGVPGTHDVSLGIDVLSNLKSGKVSNFSIPQFDKALDDRKPDAEALRLDDKVDIVLFEGWCVGSKSQQEIDLNEPVNKLEATEDPDGDWRRYVNDQLAMQYPSLFDFIDILLMIRIPDMKYVYEWRHLQEQKLRDKQDSEGNHNLRVMNDEQLDRFIMHYERVTRSTLEEMPSRADVVLDLNKDHQVERVTLKGIDD